MNEISLFSLLNLALKHLALIILTALVFAIGAFGYCKYIAVPRYSATGSILVTNGAITDISNIDKKDKLDNTDVIASLNFIPTAEDMLKQRQIYKSLANKLDNKYSYDRLMSMSTVKRRGSDSLYIDVSFTARTVAEAVMLVNEYMDVTPEYVKAQVSSVAVYCNDADNASKVSPRTPIIVSTAAIAGALLVYVILLAIFFVNNTVINEDDFKTRFDVPVIGSIPDFSSSRKANKYNRRYYGYYSYYGRGNNYGK